MKSFDRRCAKWTDLPADLAFPRLSVPHVPYIRSSLRCAAEITYDISHVAICLIGGGRS